MTEAGKLKVEIRDNRMIVSVGDKISVRSGKTQLKKEGADTLKEVTAVLKDVAGRDFQVAGHTDNTPIRSARFRSNWDLSTARAVEVVNFMVASGMQPGRLSAAGYGDQAPDRHQRQRRRAAPRTGASRSRSCRISTTYPRSLTTQRRRRPPERPAATIAPTPKGADLPGPAGAPAPMPALLSPAATPMSSH